MIEFKKVSKSYKKGIKAVDNLSLTIVSTIEWE